MTILRSMDQQIWIMLRKVTPPIIIIKGVVIPTPEGKWDENGMKGSP